MSIWWNKRDKQSRAVYSIGVLPFVIVVIGVVIALLVINLTPLLR
jgi:hypothetical protein